VTHTALDAVPGCHCRHCRITILLTWYDLVADRGSSSGTGNDPGGAPLMSREWHHSSYQELELCLWKMRSNGHAQHRAHVKAYYSAPIRLINRHGKVLGPQGRLIPVEITDDKARRAERVVPTWVQPVLVTIGLEIIDHDFRGDPSLPNAFLGGIAA
jgi:hypothetical protein